MMRKKVHGKNRKKLNIAWTYCNQEGIKRQLAEKIAVLSL